MVQEQNHDLLIKAQVLEAVQKIGLADSPQGLLNTLADTPIIAQATRSTLILFNPAAPPDAPEATTVAELDTRTDARTTLGATYTPQDIPLFWELDPAQPFIVEAVDTDTNLNDHARQVLQRLGIGSLVALSLTAAEYHLGWLLVEMAAPQAFNPADVTFLQILTEHLAVALRNQYLLQQTKDQAEHIEHERNQLQTLQQVAVQLDEAKNLADFLQTLIESRPAFEATLAIVYLQEESGLEQFLQSPMLDIPIDFVRQIPDILPAHLVEPLLVSDFETDSPWKTLADTCHRLDPTSLLLIPLGIGSGRVRGFLLLVYTDPNPNLTSQFKLARSINAQIKITLKNIFLLQDTQEALQENQILLNASRELLAATSMEQVYETVTQTFIAAGADRCTLSTYVDFDQENRPARSKIAAIKGKRDFPQNKNLQMQIGNTYDLTQYPHLSSVMTTRDMLVINDISHNPHLNNVEKYYLNHIGAHAIVLLPLAGLNEQRRLGYMFIERLRPLSFTDRELGLFRTIANQTAIALENAWQVRQTQQRARQLQTGAEISRIASTILDQHSLMAQAVNLIKTGFDFYYVGLFMADDAREWAVLQAGTGSEGEAQLRANHRLALDDHSMIGWCITHQQARIALDVGQDAVRFANPYLPFTRSEMALPLVSRGKAIGALTVQHTQPAAFSEDDVTSLQIMADQLANAIDNARQYQTVQQNAQELNALLEINRDLSASTSLHDLLNLIVHRAGDLVHGDQGAIFLVEDDILVPQIVTGEGADEMMTMRLRIGEGVSGTAAQRRRTVARLIETEEQIGVDAAQVPDTPLEPESLVAVPIQTEAELIGVLLISRVRYLVKFTKDEISLLEGLAQQAAIAVKNAQLLTASQKSQKETDILYQTTRQLAGVETAPAAAEIAVKQAAKYQLDRVLVGLKTNPDQPMNDEVHVVAAWDSDGREADYRDMHLTAQTLPMLKSANLEQPLVINDFTQHPMVDEASYDQMVKRGGMQSAAIYPLKSGHKLLGWLVAEKKTPGFFTPAAIAPLQAITDQLGVALDRIQKTESLIEAGQRYLGMVDNIPGAVYRSPAHNPYHFDYVSDDLAEITGYAVADFLGADGLDFRKLIHPQDYTIVETGWQEQLQKGHTYHLEYRIIHKNGQPRFISEQGRATVDKAGKLLYYDGIMFDVTERIQLEQANRRRATQLEAVATVGQRASGILDVDRLLNETVEIICQKFNFYYAAIFMLDANKEWAVLKAGSGEPGQKMLAENHRLKRDESSMVGWATYHAEPHIALKAKDETHRFDNPHLPLTRSEIALPLIVRGEVIGAIDVQSVEENAFSEADITTFQLMADQLANAIDNATLFATTQRNLQRVNLLYQTTQALLGVNTEAELFSAFVHSLQSLDVDTISVNVYGGPPENRHFEVRETWAKEGQPTFERGTRFPTDASTLSLLFAEGQSVLITDTRTDPRLDTPSGRQVAKDGVYALVGIPLKVRGQNAGVVVITSKDPARTFTENELHYFENLVQQLSVAWQLLQLVASVERGFRREQLIRQITAKIHAASNIEDIMKVTTTELSKALGASGGLIKLEQKQPSAPPALDTVTKQSEHSTSNGNAPAR